MLMKFSEKAQKAIVVAESIAFNLGHPNVGSEHLLLSLLKMQDLTLCELLKKYHVTDRAIEADLVRLFGKTGEQMFYMEYTDVFKQILENAVLLGQEQGQNRVSAEVLCIALLDEEKSVAHELLASYHVPFETIRQTLANTKPRNTELSKISDLINLNEKVKKKEPLVIGRTQELNELIEILCRKEKNNVLIVGDAGVGKTALVEKLAIYINHSEPSHPLHEKSIYELDLASVVAGTKYRGEFEDKLKKIIHHVKTDGQAIIFIDEIHNLVGAGGAEGAIDASNILKPYLARGEITCIGATTYEEYRRYFEKDRALNRRFGRIDLKEEGAEACLKILLGLKQRFEHYHQVEIDDHVLKQIVALSGRYIKERHQPDAAIDVLDLACVKAKMASKKVVDEEMVKQVVERISGMNLHQEKPLNSLKTKLCHKIHGQSAVIDQLISQLALVEAGLTQENQPKMVALFAGPTGVGKTEMAKMLAADYYGHLIRLDLSEYKEPHSISKIIGSPPGYVGYEQASGFLDEVRRYPHSVILLDEIDKAHKDVLHLFLQVFDEGFIEDRQKNKVDFSNSIIVMTTNMGYHLNGGRRVGFQEDKQTTKARTMLESQLSLEFLNRIDYIFYFNHLTKADCLAIIQDYLDQWHTEMTDLSQCDDHWKEKIIAQCDIDKYGARSIARVLRKQLYETFFKTPTT